jgi:hypothetical protein
MVDLDGVVVALLSASPDHKLDSEAIHEEKQGVEQDCEIEKNAAILDVIQVIFDGMVDNELSVAAQLPEAGQTLWNRQPATFERGVGLSDVGHLRTWPDQRHFPHQYVP